jgi:Domain of unknown function (DUF4189)
MLCYLSQQRIKNMRRLTLALGGALLLAGSAFAQSNKTVSQKAVADYKAVQEHLYGLNYDVGERSGQLTPQLKAAIAQWRKNRASTAAGDMSETEAAQLLALGLPKTWGTIAYAASGPVIAISGKPSRDAAEKEAQAACEKDSKKCTLVSAAGTSCAAVASFSGSVDGKASMGTWGSYRPNQAAAKDAALADCKKNAPLPDTCAVRETICADGSHKK